MKIFYIILALVISNMNVLPNFNGLSCNDDHAGHAHHHDHEAPEAPEGDEEDHCVAFLHCHGGVILTEGIVHIPSISSWERNDQKQDNYHTIYGFNYLKEIWHPPAELS